MRLDTYIAGVTAAAATVAATVAIGMGALTPVTALAPQHSPQAQHSPSEDRDGDGGEAEAPTLRMVDTSDDESFAVVQVARKKKTYAGGTPDRPIGAVKPRPRLSAHTWNCLLARGWRGRPGDGREQIWATDGAVRSCAASGPRKSR